MNLKAGRSPGQNFNKYKYYGRQHEFNKYICPAFNKICNICQKKGHFSICCRTRNSNINYMQEENRKQNDRNNEDVDTYE